MKRIVAAGLTISCLVLWLQTSEAATRTLKLAHEVSV
jgi:hypothetical protein